MSETEVTIMTQTYSSFLKLLSSLCRALQDAIFLGVLF